MKQSHPDAEADKEVLIRLVCERDNSGYIPSRLSGLHRIAQGFGSRQEFLSQACSLAAWLLAE